MEVAIVLLYVVVGVCVLACVGMGVVAFLSWRQDRSWGKARESFNEQSRLALEENLRKKDRLTYESYKIRSGQADYDDCEASARLKI